MSIHDDFINKAVEHPQWEVIRNELCPDDNTEPDVVEIAPGLRVWMGEGFQTEKQKKDAELHCEICWWIGNGPGYCETAPEHIKVYLRRLGIKC